MEVRETLLGTAERCLERPLSKYDAAIIDCMLHVDAHNPDGFTASMIAEELLQHFTEVDVRDNVPELSDAISLGVGIRDWLSNAGILNDDEEDDEDDGSE